MSETNRTTPALESATPIDHELCGAQHPTEDVTCALVDNPWDHVHVGHRAGDEPLEQRAVTWGGPAPDAMTVTISLSSSARNESPEVWQASLEKMLDRFSDEIFEAGGSINIGDCGRSWCTEMDIDDEGGEHARHHVGKPVDLGGVDAAPEGPWTGYLLQKPGDMDFDTVKVVMINDGNMDFEIPVWQLVVLRGLFTDKSARAGIAKLLRQAAAQA